jgi:hypothetical protein
VGIVYCYTADFDYLGYWLSSKKEITMHISGGFTTWALRELSRQDKLNALFKRRAKLDEEVARLSPHHFVATQINQCVTCKMREEDAIHSGGRSNLK